MTTQELINYYANLLIFQYVGSTSNYAAIQTLVSPVIMDQLPTQVMNAFNLMGADPAEGVQLDVLGKYAGVGRTGNGFNGPITLSDSDYLSLIRMAIVQNNSGSSLADIQNLLNGFFPNQILAFDYANMRMSYLVNSSIGSVDLMQLFINNNLLPKPMGVQLAVVIYSPVIDTYFGFCQYELPVNNFVSPFNTYEDYHEDYPWISYTDAFNG